MVRMSDSACGWSTPLKEQFLINLKVIEERIIKKNVKDFTHVLQFFGVVSSLESFKEEDEEK